MDKIIEWKDIAGFMKSNKTVFSPPPEMHLWAGKAWRCIIDLGLASYANEIEKHVVLPVL